MKTYRPDIDGLRALSVLGVLAFHAKLPFAPGGFVGVDVFFVISGFLITGILLAEHERTGSISFRDFWARRVRRLAPALLFVLAGVALLSLVFLERISGETGALARATIATLALNANHFFMREAGDYFAATAEHNPLLHMWSLSVEEQFYLAWPLLLSVLAIGSQMRLKVLVAGLCLVSFIASWHWSLTDSPRAFYLMPSRAWELMAGALTALAMRAGTGPGRSPSAGASVDAGASASASRAGPALVLVAGLAGLGLIIASFGYLGTGSAFPAPVAALPVLGAVIVLLAGGTGRDNVVSRLLGSRPMAYLGRVSYPLYLWHWPILVLQRSQRLYEPSMSLDLTGLLLALLAAVFTYEFVERKVWARTREASSVRTIGYGVAGMTAVLALALMIGFWVRSGFGYSPEELVLDASRKDLADTGCLFSSSPGPAAIDKCFPTSGKPSILLWGDSHAEHWAPALALAAGKLDLGLGVLTRGGCRPLSLPTWRADCSHGYQSVVANFPSWRRNRQLVGIVISARWAEGFGHLSPSIADQPDFATNEYYDSGAKSPTQALARFVESLTALVERAKRQGIRVLIVLPSPVQRYSAQQCLAVKSQQACFVDLAVIKDFVGPIENAILAVAKDNDNVRVIDPKSFMCAGGQCPVVLDGTIAYVDDDHVSRSFSSASSEQFTRDLEWLGGRKMTASVGRLQP